LTVIVNYFAVLYAFGKWCQRCSLH